MTILSTFLESSLNFLSNDIKQHYKVNYSQCRKILLKFELSERQFERTVRDKIACKT